MKRHTRQQILFVTYIIYIITTTSNASPFASIDYGASFPPKPPTTWKAKLFVPIMKLTKNEIQKSYLGVLGTLDNKKSHATTTTIPPPNQTAYDWRHSTCVGDIIENQGKCGSCWAVSAVEVFSDRYCLTQEKLKKLMKQKNQQVTTRMKKSPNNTPSPPPSSTITTLTKRIQFSALDLIACDKLCKFLTKCCRGCAGGYPSLAWKYIQTKGVVTNTCMPYNLTRSLLCPPNSCSPPLSNTKYKVKKYMKIYGGANAIKQELIKNGPVQATFYVYEDFMHYHSGIYKHESGRLLGLHAVKIVGYNVTTVVNRSSSVIDVVDSTKKEMIMDNEVVDNNDINQNTTINYWIVANSWGRQWGGIGGYFYIAENECGFEENVYAGTPGTPITDEINII